MSAIPVNLKTDSMINPQGIDSMQPVFSWQLRSTEKNVVQTAYQIVVADSDSVVWDSGKVQSYQVLARYQGAPIQARKIYQWSVTIWDNHGSKAQSDQASFEIGLFKDDWKAKWIEPVQLDAVPDKTDWEKFHESIVRIDEGLKPFPSNYSKLRPPQFIRKDFCVGRGIKRARAYVTARGIYRLEVNGVRAGHAELTPDFTSYPKYLQYQTYDITDLLADGANAIGAVVADGWYISRIGNSGESCGYGNRLALLLQVEIEYEDGSYDTLYSDENFKSSTGPLEYSDLTIGERYDARKEMTGWSMPGYGDSTWKQCTVKGYGYDNITAQCSPPVVVSDELKAVCLFTAPNGDTLVDFGQVIAGRVRFRIKGNAGDVIKIEHYETLGSDGNVQWNISGLNKDQTLFYVCKGQETEEYEAQFTFMGFRYIALEGYTGELHAEDFTAVALSSIKPYDSVFQCSDVRLNRLHQNTVWSQKANMISIPTDCPQREKMGWTGDIQVYVKTACLFADMKPFLTRWLANARLEQCEKGEVGFFVPNPNFYKEDSGYWNSAGWGDAAVIVPYTLYQYYSDRNILQENYTYMKRWLEYVEASARDNLSADLEGKLDETALERQKYIWNTGFQWGDWAAPSDTDVDPVHMPPYEKRMYAGVVATCFYAYSAGLFSEIAGILGNKEDEEYYRELSRKVKQTFIEEFIAEDGSLPRRRQGDYVLTLCMEMAPESMRPKIAGHLADLIRENGCRLDTGFLSTPFLLDTLMKYGYKDLAYKLFYQTECPSWLYEVNKGATTIWEKWNAIRPDGSICGTSFNHYSFGCIGDWMLRKLAGLNMAESSYRKSIIAPDLDCGLDFVKARTETIYGEIACSWYMEGDKAVIDVTIPPNTTSEIVLPYADGGKVTRIATGSGNYHFEYNY